MCARSLRELDFSREFSDAKEDAEAFEALEMINNRRTRQSTRRSPRQGDAGV